MARGINKVLLIEDIESSIEYARSHRKFSTSREALLRAFALITDTKSQSPISSDEARQIERLRNKLLNQLKVISKKQFLQSQSHNHNFATCLLLRNKLKPTSDGKDDSIDNKAANEIQRFFINLWNLIHVKPQNRAFT